jgi:hypothetical protein
MTVAVARALASLLLLAGLSSAQSAQIPPNDLVRQVVNSELKAEGGDHVRWMYLAQSDKQNGSKEVDKVVETCQGSLRRPVEIDGREPTAEEQQRADQVIQQLTHDSGALQKAQKESKDDRERTQRMLTMLPDAFLFTYAEDRGDLVKLNFAPNPKFDPPTREAEVFHSLEGYVWVQRKQTRLAEIAGRLTHKVKFGGGLLGHLDEGGTFDVKQTEVAPGTWKLTQMNINMTGRVLFFKTIAEQEKNTRSDFSRVPDNLTLVEAADILQKQATQARVNQPGKASTRTVSDR